MPSFLIVAQKWLAPFSVRDARFSFKVQGRATHARSACRSNRLHRHLRSCPACLQRRQTRYVRHRRRVLAQELGIATRAEKEPSENTSDLCVKAFADLATCTNIPLEHV